MQFSIFVHHKKLGGKLPCGPGCGPLLGGPGMGCMPGSGPKGSKRGCGKPAPDGRPGTGLNPPGLNGKFGNKSPWPPEINDDDFIIIVISNEQITFRLY